MTDSKRILIVEDDALIAMDLEDELADRGYASVWANSVPAAQRILDDETPSVVILDMRLKSETTFDLATSLHERGLPFIFLSGNDASSLPEHLKSCTILTKPVHMGKVVAHIAKLAK